MKILVQDLDSRRFLSADGRWVAEKDDARDFYSLLPAYYYARDHTSRRFQVLLYCPDDMFCVSMIAGAGVAHKKVKLDAGHRPKSRICLPAKNGLHRINGVILPTRFDDVRRHLN